MAEKKQKRRRNYYAARLRRKLRLRQAFIDRSDKIGVSCFLCDLPDQVSEHAAKISAGHPSPEAQGESTDPPTGAAFSDERPNDDEGHDHEDPAT